MSFQIQQSSIGGPWETLSPEGKSDKFEDSETAEQMVLALREHWSCRGVGPSIVDFRVVEVEND